MVKPVRRIVTGHDGEGRSVFLEDGPAPNPFSPSHSPNVGLTNLWLLDAVPATNEAGQADPTARPFRRTTRPRVTPASTRPTASTTPSSSRARSGR